MIAAARTALASILTGAGLRVFPFTPERAAPPMAILTPSGDWVASGDTFRAFRIGFDVNLIVQNAANETMIKALDELVDDTLVAITNATGFYASQVGSPTLIDISGADYLSTTITVYQNTQL
jgi:type IV secretory pathway VirB9-like protein